MKRARDLTLTPEQRALFDGEPGIAELAVARVDRELRGRVPRAAMITDATIGAMESARSYDPAMGSFRTWALFHAVFAILDGVRDEARGNERLRAAARAACLRHLTRTAHAEAGFYDPPERATAKLQAFSDGMYASACSYVATVEVPLDGEDAMIERMAAARAGDALRAALASLEPTQRQLVELYFEEGLPITQAAPLVMEKYARALSLFATALARIRARLVGMGITEMPPWQSEVSGKALSSRRR